jgi:hypothetical protein
MSANFDVNGSNFEDETDDVIAEANHVQHGSAKLATL